MDYPGHFKSEFIGALFKLTSANWLKITVAYFIYLILSLLLAALFLWFFVGNQSPYPFFKTNSGLFNSSYLTLLPGMFQKFIYFIAWTLLYVLISTLLSSWLYNYSFVTAERTIKGGKAGFGIVFRKSFSTGIFKIALMSLLYLLFSIAVFIAAMKVISISEFLLIPVFLVSVYLLFKSILILPAYVIGRESFVGSFRFSFTHITTVRTLKLFGISLLILLFIFLLTYLLLLLQKIAITTTWVVVFVKVAQLIAQVVFAGYFTALFTSALAGLYFRYSDKKDVLIDEENTGSGESKDDDDDLAGGGYDFTKNLFA